jgi:alpha-tubulin suppressor-like RCC1 family protein
MARVRWLSLVIALALGLGCTPTEGPKEREAGTQADAPEPADQLTPPGGLAPPVPGQHRIAAGQHHTCTIRAGAIYCWGANSQGQLGDRSQVDRARPVPVHGIDNAVSIAAGAEHTCAVLEDGSVRCWGSNAEGQIGAGSNGAISDPTTVPQIRGAKAITANRWITCVVDGNAEVQCWGSTKRGESPIEFEALDGVSEVASAHSTVCAVDSNHRVACRGMNYFGTLGAPGPNLRANVVAGIDEVRMLTAGTDHVCAIDAAGKLACWGSSYSGQTGAKVSSAVVADSAATLGSLPPLVSVSASLFHTCAVTKDGRVACWGSNDDRRAIPDSKDEGTEKPRFVAGVEGAVEVAAGGYHTCALLGDGEVRCWGDNSRGQLGDGVPQEAGVAIGLAKLPGITDAQDLDAATDVLCVVVGQDRRRSQCFGKETWAKRTALPTAGDVHKAIRGSGDTMCALLEDGRATCVFQGDEIIDATEHLRVSSISVGGTRVCGLLTSGGIACGTMVGSLELDSQNPFPKARDVRAGGQRVCVLDDENRVTCWEWDTFPREQRPPDQIPTVVQDIEGAQAIEMASWTACATFENGDVKCWDEQRDKPRQPRVMPGMPAIQQVVGMDTHTCALSREGEVWCWGRNLEGQLGDGTTGERTDPVRVRGIPAMVQLAGDFYFTCGRTAAGEVWCWGELPFAGEPVAAREPTPSKPGKPSGPVVAVVGLPAAF